MLIEYIKLERKHGKLKATHEKLMTDGAKYMAKHEKLNVKYTNIKTRAAATAQAATTQAGRIPDASFLVPTAAPLGGQKPEHSTEMFIEQVAKADDKLYV